MIYIASYVPTQPRQLRFIGTQICVGDDPSFPTAQGNECSQKYYEGGFLDLDLSPGRYIFLYREDSVPLSGAGDKSYFYNVAEVRVY